ncbi:MAG: hypothetical protein HXS54_01455 [Theionarchaea archaeon]|nr:hypothetical protein [Theionarchaea archaeon]
MTEINGYTYRFSQIEDPPFAYGIGLDDPDSDFWIIPAYGLNPTRVYIRRHNEVVHPDSLSDRAPWHECLDDAYGLKDFGDFISGLSFDFTDDFWVRINGHGFGVKYICNYKKDTCIPKDQTGKEHARKIRKITVMAFEGGYEKQGTSLWIEETDKRGKWVVYDVCEEDIQGDGDGTKEICESYEEALEFARNEAEGYRKTYEGLDWDVRVTEE